HRAGALWLAPGHTRHERRLWTRRGRPEMVKQNNDQRHDDREREMKVLAELMRARTADEWETFLQANHVPAGRIRTLPEALADPQLATRNFLHEHKDAAGVDGAVTVPVAAFKFAHRGPEVTAPPRPAGADTDTVLAELGYDAKGIAAIRGAKAD